MIVLALYCESCLQRYNICLKQLSAITCKQMLSGYSMNYYQIVTEINKKDTDYNPFNDKDGDTVICSQSSNQFIARLIAGGKSSS